MECSWSEYAIDDNLSRFRWIPEKWFYEVKWHHKPRPEPQVLQRSAEFIPSSREIAQAVAREVRQLDDAVGWSTVLSRAAGPFETLSAAYIAQALHDLGWPYKPGDRITPDSLMEQLPLASRYQRLMRRFMRILERGGYLTAAGTDTWAVCHMPAEQDLPKLWQQTLSQHPAFFAELSLIARCGSHLAAVLRRERDPLQLLFSEGSSTTTEHFYQDSPSFRPYNTIVQKAVSHTLGRLPEGGIVRILEVGAGTGGMTAYVLPELPASRTEYVFSDVTPVFLAKAEQKFRDYPFVRFQTLDIEKDPLLQGYEPHSFDLILASDVLHATSDLHETLGNSLKLLSSKGLLILLEIEKAQAWLDLVFGLIEGWWRFRDFDRQPDHPLITRSAWKATLETVGFTDVMDVSVSPDEGESVQVVTLARGPSIQEAAPDFAKAMPAPRADGEQGRWLIFADSGSIAQKLVELLTWRGEAGILVTPGAGFQRLDGECFQISPDDPADMERLLQAV